MRAFASTSEAAFLRREMFLVAVPVEIRSERGLMLQSKRAFREVERDIRCRAPHPASLEETKLTTEVDYFLGAKVSVNFGWGKGTCRSIYEGSHQGREKFTAYSLFFTVPKSRICEFRAKFADFRWNSKKSLFISLFLRSGPVQMTGNPHA